MLEGFSWEQVLVLQVLRLAALLSTIVAFVSWIIWIIKNPGKSLYAVPPLSWLLNVVLYSWVILSGTLTERWPIDAAFVSTLWRYVITVQAVSTIAGIAVVLLFWRNRHPFQGTK